MHGMAVRVPGGPRGRRGVQVAISKSAVNVTKSEGEGLGFFWIMKCEQPVFERPSQKTLINKKVDAW